MNGWRDEGMNGWMDKGINGWMGEWIKGWMDEFKLPTPVLLYLLHRIELMFVSAQNLEDFSGEPKVNPAYKISYKFRIHLIGSYTKLQLTFIEKTIKLTLFQKKTKI